MHLNLRVRIFSTKIPKIINKKSKTLKVTEKNSLSFFCTYPQILETADSHSTHVIILVSTGWQQSVRNVWRLLW